MTDREKIRELETLIEKQREVIDAYQNMGSHMSKNCGYLYKNSCEVCEEEEQKALDEKLDALREGDK
jgi:predicted aconitase